MRPPIRSIRHNPLAVVVGGPADGTHLLSQPRGVTSLAHRREHVRSAAVFGFCFRSQRRSWLRSVAHAPSNTTANPMSAPTTPGKTFPMQADALWIDPR